MFSSIQTELTALHCPKCFIAYAIPTKMYEARLSDGLPFCCPGGHRQSYLHKLIRRDDAAERRRVRGLRRDRIRRIHDEEQAEARRERKGE